MYPKTLMVLAVVLSLGLPCAAYPHETSQPPGAVDEHTALMLRQHQAMLAMQAEWDKAKKAVKGNNPGLAVPAVAKMEHEAASLDKFMLHKQPEKRGEFLMKAAALQGLLIKFKEHAERGDNAFLKKLIPKVDRACAGCHRTFR